MSNKEVGPITPSVLAPVVHSEDVDVRNHLWQTPLYCAASTGNVTLVRQLILAGAKLNARAKKRFTPLHIASRFGHLEVMQVN